MSVLDLWAIFYREGLGRIIALSLTVSLSATALATLFGTPHSVRRSAARLPSMPVQGDAFW